MTYFIVYIRGQYIISADISRDLIGHFDWYELLNENLIEIIKSYIN